MAFIVCIQEAHLYILQKHSQTEINWMFYYVLLYWKKYPSSQIDLTQPLEPQGPFDVIIHKLSDIIVEAEHDSKSQQMLADFQVRLQLIKKGIEKHRRSEWSVAWIFSHTWFWSVTEVLWCVYLDCLSDYSVFEEMEKFEDLFCFQLRATCQLIPILFSWTPYLQWLNSSTALPPIGSWPSYTKHSEVNCIAVMWTAADMIADNTACLYVWHYTDWRICSPPYLEIHNASDLSSIQQSVRNQGLSFPLGLFACLKNVHILIYFKTNDFYIESFYLKKEPKKHFLLFPVLTAVCKTRVAHGSLSHEVGGLPEISTCPLTFALVMISSDSAASFLCRCLWSSALGVWWTSILPVFSRASSTTEQSCTKCLSLATVTSVWRGPRSRTSPLDLVVGWLHPWLSVADFSFLSVCRSSLVLFLAFISFPFPQPHFTYYLLCLSVFTF